MSIYNYRKIYQDHFGQIPIDNLGRSYEIHHIDGNRNNNSIENLKCVSIDEHYKIHYEQGDYAACLLMSERMKILPKQKSLLSKKINEEQLKNGTHPFTTEKYKKEQSKRITKINLEKSKNGTHQWGKQYHKKLLEKGKHISQQIIICPHCNFSGNKTNMMRWHFNNCFKITGKEPSRATKFRRKKLVKK